MHYHGFKWYGDAKEFGKENLRDPGDWRDSEEAREFKTGRFLASGLPPMETGHALLQRGRVSAEQTWAEAGDAVKWLEDSCTAHPPSGQHKAHYATKARTWDSDMPWSEDTYISLDARVKGALADLPLGNDVVWAWYRGETYYHCAVICCPHRKFTGIPCPLGM